MPIKVFSVAEMVAAEKAAHAGGLTYNQMMEMAGWRVAEAIMARYSVAGMNLLVLVGPGNNGGDGLVAGRYLAEAGANVAFYLYRPRDAATDTNYAKVQQMGLFILDADADQRYRALRTRLKVTDLLLDALLGTGVSRPITGEMAVLMKQVRAGLHERVDSAMISTQPGLVDVTQIHANSPSMQSPIVVAVDCPSGLNCDTGSLDELAIPADLTVTFAGPKRGHFRFPGAAACGSLIVADIGIEPDLPDVMAVAVNLMTAIAARHLLPERPLNGHKGSFGWALIVAGSAQYWGAPVLAARGAYRVGAGLVALAVPERIRATIAGQLPEATYPVLTDQSHLGVTSARTLLKMMGTYKSLLIGPGLGRVAEFMEVVFKEGGQPPKLPPLVIDADGLNWLSGLSEWHKRLPPRTILTPHPGEMARLMGAELLTEMQELDRVALARHKAAEWGHVVVLKGAYTVVADPQGQAYIVPFANPILGAAGSGDVLAGIIVGLLAQGLAAFDAALLGTYLHGAAGQLASLEMGSRGLLASEIAERIPQVCYTLLA